MQQGWFSKADINKHTPVVRSLPEEKIPVEVVKEGDGGTWIWELLCVATLGDIAAAAGGGNDQPDTGDVEVSL